MAGDTVPTVHIPSVVGRPSARSGGEASVLPEVVVGHDCVRHRHQLTLSQPIAHGIVQNWEDMRCVWRHVFHDALKV